MNWLLKLIFKALAEMLGSIIKKFANLFNNVFDEMYEIFKTFKLESVANFTAGIGIGLVTIFIIKQLLEVYIFETEGDSDDDPLDIVTRASIAIMTILCGNEVIDFMIKGAGQFTKELLDHVNYLKTKLSFSDMVSVSIESMIGTPSSSMFVILIMFIIIIIAYIIILFKAAKRAAELMLFQIVLPIIACDMLTKTKERWNAFKSELLLCIFGYSFQLLSFNVFLVLFSKIGTDFSMKYIIGSITWLWLVISAPKWLQKFIYSSGLGNGSKGVVRSATYMLPGLLRR